jgi:hypothetical protein
MSRWLRTGSALAVALLVAAPATAAVYAIQMNNGTTFETRFKPLDAEYDAGKVVFVDEVGNLIALPKSEIASIDSDVESSGFGHVIDNTTIALGWAPNDAPEQGTAQDKARQAAIDAANAGPRTPAEPIYDVNTSPGTINWSPVFSSEAPATGVVFSEPVGSQPVSSEPVAPPPGE